MFWLRHILPWLKPRNALRIGATQARNRRVSAPSRIVTNTRLANIDMSRARRGLHMVLPSSWRRTTIGSNHISAFGVWRIGTRRTALRINCTGETRWHRPCRVQA